MKVTKIMMGMPIVVEISGCHDKKIFKKVFDYFNWVDQTFSTYKKKSEISRYNDGLIKKTDFSPSMKEIFKKASETKKLTKGYFDIKRNGKYDPSGIVKGWAILGAANIIRDVGYKNCYVSAGGDIQTLGLCKGYPWKIGLRNPFELDKVIKIVNVSGEGVATSGTYERGSHIYNPKQKGGLKTDIVCITIVGPDIYEADRFATAAFAMGRSGIEYVEGLSGFEGYQIDKKGIATMTSGFERYTI